MNFQKRRAAPLKRTKLQQFSHTFLGFTALEVLVAVGVLVILMSIVYFSLRNLNQPAKNRNVERTLEVNTIQEALDQYVLEGGTYPLPGVPTTPICIGTKTWAQLSPSGSAPSARQGHSAVWDAQNSRMLVFGGTDEVSSFYNDIYSYTPSSNLWVQLTPSGTLPPGLREHSAVWDSVGNRMIVWGGENAAPSPWNLTNNRVYIYTSSSNSWAEITPSNTPPSGRLDAAAAWDPTSNRMLIFGGSQAGNVMAQDLWAYNPVANTFTQISYSGTPPSSRAAASMVWDAQNSRFIVFGGNVGSGSYSNSLHYFNPVTNVWSQPTITGTLPSAREDHSAVWDTLSNRMLVFGGWNGGSFFQDVWSFSPTTNTWTQLPSNGTIPQARDEHAAVWDGRQMIVFGGDNGPGNLNDLFQSPGCYDLTPYIVPTYVPAVPEDPLSTGGQVDTGYTIQKDPVVEKTLTVSAPMAELGSTILKSK